MWADWLCIGHIARKSASTSWPIILSLFYWNNITFCYPIKTKDFNFSDKPNKTIIFIFFSSFPNARSYLSNKRYAPVNKTHFFILYSLNNILLSVVCVHKCVFILLFLVIFYINLTYYKFSSALSIKKKMHLKINNYVWTNVFFFCESCAAILLYRNQ